MTRITEVAKEDEDLYYETAFTWAEGERRVYLISRFKPRTANEARVHISPVPRWKPLVDCSMQPTNFDLKVWAIFKREGATIFDRAGVDLCWNCVHLIPRVHLVNLPIRRDGEHYKIDTVSNWLQSRFAGGDSNGER